MTGPVLTGDRPRLHVGLCMSRVLIFPGVCVLVHVCTRRCVTGVHTHTHEPRFQVYICACVYVRVYIRVHVTVRVGL